MKIGSASSSRDLPSLAIQMKEEASSSVLDVVKKTGRLSQREVEVAGRVYKVNFSYTSMGQFVAEHLSISCYGCEHMVTDSITEEFKKAFDMNNAVELSSIMRPGYIRQFIKSEKFSRS